MHHEALEVKIFAYTVKALARRVANIWVHTSDGTKCLCEYWDSVGRGNVTDRDMSFHMKLAAVELGYPSRNILFDRIDTNSNWAGRACAIKMAEFDDEIIRKWKDGCLHCMISLNTFNSSQRGYLKVWQPK